MIIQHTQLLSTARSRSVPGPAQVGLDKTKPESSATQTDEIELTAAPRKSLPDFSAFIEPKGDATQLPSKLKNATDGWVENNLGLSDPRELDIMKGLGRWVATQAKLRVKPEWKPFEWARQTTDLWDDEELGARAPLAPVDDTLPAKERADMTDGSANKTLGVLRMLDSYLGEGVVDASVRLFLETAANGAPASLRNFHKTLAEQAKDGPPLTSFEAFKGWFDQVGHPILRTSLDGHQMNVRQSGFSVYNDQKVGNEDATWTIPMRVKYKDATGIKEFSTLLEPGESQVKLPADGKVEWAYPNGGGMGVFRTALDADELQAITKDAGKLTPAEQTALMCNQWRLVRHGEAKIGEFYDLLLSMKEYLDPGLLHVALIELTTHSSFVRPEDRKAYAEFATEVLGPTARQIGLETDAGMDSRSLTSRRFMAEFMVDAGDSDARRVAQGWADHLLATGEDVAWGAATLTGDARVADFLWNRVETHIQNQENPSNELSRLGLLDSPGNASKLFSFLRDPETRISQQTRENALWAMTYSPDIKPMVCEALRNDPNSLSNSEQLLKSLAYGSHRKEVEALLAGDTIEPQIRERVTAAMSGGAATTLRNLPDDIHDYLQQRSKPEATEPIWNLLS